MSPLKITKNKKNPMIILISQCYPIIYINFLITDANYFSTYNFFNLLHSPKTLENTLN